MADDMGDKTEEASGKKLQDAREEGRVPKSADLAGAIDLAGGLILFMAVGIFIWEGTGRFMERVLRYELGPEALNPSSVTPLLRGAGTSAAYALIPFLVGALCIAIMAHGVQVGFLWTTKPLVPKLDRLNPVAGFQRLFGIKNAVKTGVNTIKLAAVLFVGTLILIKDSEKVAALPMMSLAAGLRFIGTMAMELAIWLVVIMLVIGVADWLYQRWQHAKDLRMTKQESKDERKNMDGDPEIKSKRMRMMRQIAAHRAKQAVPNADVVVTNPTHFSVAIKYDGASMRAPRVVAKGADAMAFYIRELAKGAGVPVLERPPLARALYYGVDVGREIPQEQFQAVAEILAYVYRLKERAPVAA